ncbi:unnamed protein product [Rodentolepis nana]|uniref:DUF4604 domain-containing protein n=1 Tax=Rodentolepis nana TaxID=102285 RepID=A0A0R3T5V6_RODNA|nr:unnamed protein product [Rodentolepis nana]
MQSEPSLPNFFNKILQNYLKIKKDEISSSNEGFKGLIEQSCALCDEAIRRINQLDLFSKNESLDDLSTSSIRYLTLPAFLAFYTSQKFDRDERLTSLKLTQTYYDEFFDSIESYGFPDLPKLEKPSGDEPSSKFYLRSPRVDPEKQRNERIKAYKEKKSLDERLEKFLSLNSPTVDEEMLREESIGLIRYWAFTAVEELRLIKSEVELLEKFQGQNTLQQPPPRKPSGPTQPPLVITREKILAATFGAGYPSVPTMTLDQFVDLQVKQGLMPPPQQMKSRTSTNNSSSSSNGASWHRIDPSDTAEAKEADEEKMARYDALEDAHSEEQRAKAQRFDEFKDEHRRGSGNRANPEEPAFIKRFREQSGMKPEATVKDKMRSRIQLENDDDFRDREDEAPQVVAGVGVSEEEASEYAQKILVKHPNNKVRDDSDKSEDEGTPEEIEAEKSGKIVFRRPKTKQSKVNDDKAARKKDSEDRKKFDKLRERRKKNENPGGTLSFNLDEECEDD